VFITKNIHVKKMNERVEESTEKYTGEGSGTNLMEMRYRYYVIL
jgi:hypothetical protein